MIKNGSVRGINNPISKQVIQLNNNNEFIKLWDYMNQARDELKINNITKTCRGERKTAGGFVWRYPGDENLTFEEVKEKYSKK